jgi:hypothetical protein
MTSLTSAWKDEGVDIMSGVEAARRVPLLARMIKRPAVCREHTVEHGRRTTVVSGILNFPNAVSLAEMKAATR